MPNKKKRWTEQEIETIKCLTRQNYSNKEISNRINRSERSVAHVKTKMGFTTPKFQDFVWTDNDLNKLKNLREEGYSESKLAKIFNRSIAAIKSRLLRDNIKSPKRSKLWTEEENTILKEMINSGYSKREIAVKLKKSLCSVRTRSVVFKMRSYNPPRVWTTEEFEVFKQLLSRGLKIEEISIEMNRGVHGLISKAKQHFLRKKFPQINEFLRNYDSCQNETFDIVMRRKIKQIKNGAKKRFIDFDLSELDLHEIWNKQNGMCYYSGENMNYMSGFYNTFSVDRIDSNKGYIKDNIVLCLLHINVFKGDMTKVEFFNLCKKITLYNNLI